MKASFLSHGKKTALLYEYISSAAPLNPLLKLLKLWDVISLQPKLLR
jgi:hypothetical protein